MKDYSFQLSIDFQSRNEKTHTAKSTLIVKSIFNI